MNKMDLLMAGVKLLIFGMGMVYFFLVIMIYSMKLLEKVLRPYAPKFEPAPPAAPAARPAPGKDDLNTAIAAAVAVHAAINRGKVAKEPPQQ